MASDALFFQGYQARKTRHSFRFWTSKRKLSRNFASVSSYASTLDASLFGYNVVSGYKKKRHKEFHFEALINLTKYFLAFLMTVSFTFLLCLTLYYLVRNATSGVKFIEFQKEETVDKFLASFVDLQGEVKEGISLPSVIREVKYTDYVVKRGDTISGIAYKMGLKNIGTIFSANNVTNAKRIMTGTHLTIPSMDGLLYTVKKNDSLDSIARSFNVPLEALLDANDLSDTEINLNTRLFIPGATLSLMEMRKAMGELFIYPINGRLTSPFGYRRDPFTGRKSFHSGIDLAAPLGTPIKVVLEGIVSLTSYSRVFGNYMIVTHSNGYQTLYGHVNAFNAKKGQRVNQGDVIALVGNTGLSTGPHVHLSIYKNGKLIDPLSVLK